METFNKLRSQFMELIKDQRLNNGIYSETADKDLKEFQKKMALEYHHTYQRTIILLFVLVLVKRYVTDESISPKHVL